MSLSMVAAAAMAVDGQVELDVIARDGDPAPGTTETLDLSFSASGYQALAIDSAATVHFFAGTSDGLRDGIWSGTGTSLNDVAVDGQVLFNFQPGPSDCDGVGPTCGQIFNTSAHLYADAQGNVMLRTTREDDMGTGVHLVGTDNNDLMPMLSSRQVAIDDFPYELGLRAEDGRMLIGGYLGSAAFGQPSGLQDFTAAYPGNAPPVIVEPVTVTGVYGTHASPIGVTYGLNQAGDLLFVLELSDSSDALYLDPVSPAVSPKLLARSGDAAPGITGAAYTAVTTSPTVGKTGAAEINDATQGCFLASWHDPLGGGGNNNLPRDGIWRFNSAGSVSLVVAEYLNPSFDRLFDTSEGPRTAFALINSPTVAPNGDIYFYGRSRQADVDGIPITSDERAGLWRAPAGGGNLELILRITTSNAPGSPLPEGPNVPGTPLPGGGYFTGFGLGGFAFDEHSHLLFDTADAVFAEDASALHRVIEKGQQIEVATGDLRTVSYFAIDTDGPISARPMGYRNDRLALRVHFDDGSNAILRSRFLPPPPPPVLRGLEVVQVAQDWNNSIPLIADKKTYVRAHIDSTASVRLYGQLTAKRDGMNLTPDPLPAANPGAYVFAGTDATLRRERLGQSLYFQLPADWTHGNVEFLVALDDETLTCQESAGPTANDCRVSVSFTTGSQLPLKLVSFAYEQSPGVFPRVDRARMQDMICHLVALMPVAGRQRCEVDWFDGLATWPYPDSPPDIYDALHYMKTYRRADGCRDEDGCMRLYQGLFRVDKVSGLARLGGTIGVVFVPSSPEAVGSTSHIHEFSHNLDRPHAVQSSLPLSPKGRMTSPCGATAKVGTPDFPYYFSNRSTLGPMASGEDALVYGLDTRKRRVVSPFRVFELMDYCRTAPDMRWPSKFTYESQRDEMTTRFGSLRPAHAMGTTADFLVVSGKINLAQRSVTFSPSLVLPGDNPPAPAPGNYQARFLDALNMPLVTVDFEPDAVEPEGDYKAIALFQVEVANDPLIRRIEIHDAMGLIGVLQSSANAPVVSVTAPAGGANETGATVDIQWTASDADGDPLFHTVQYSADDGVSWNALVANWSGSHYQVDRSALPQSAMARVRVISSDGFLTGSSTSAAFTVGNNAPFVVIQSPEDGMLFSGSQMIFLEAASQDSEDGPAASSIEWSSDVDGVLGSGHVLELAASALSVGNHVITATGTDSGAAQASDSVTISIVDAVPDSLSDLQIEVNADTPQIVPGYLAGYSVPIRNDGPQESLAATLAMTLVDASDPAQAYFQTVDAPAGVSCTLAAAQIDCDLDPLEADEERVIGVVVAGSGDGSLTLLADLDPQSNVDPRLANNLSRGVVLTDLIETAIFGSGFE